jgi:hypothetical protein
MPTFTRTLFGIAPHCNANLTVNFTKHDVEAINQAGATVLESWHDPALGLLASLKKTREVKGACWVEATSIMTVLKDE